MELFLLRRDQIALLFTYRTSSCLIRFSHCPYHSVKMQLLHVLALTLPIFALAAPRPQVTSYDASSSLSTSYSSTTTVTKSATLTVTQTAPSSAATNSTSTSSSYQSQPTAPYIVTAARSGSPIHLLPMNAAGFRFYLGGQTATYCPSFVSEGDPNACGPGDVTALLGTCNMVSLKWNVEYESHKT